MSNQNTFYNEACSIHLISDSGDVNSIDSILRILFHVRQISLDSHLMIFEERKKQWTNFNTHIKWVTQIDFWSSCKVFFNFHKNKEKKRKNQRFQLFIFIMLLFSFFKKGLKIHSNNAYSLGLLSWLRFNRLRNDGFFSIFPFFHRF